MTYTKHTWETGEIITDEKLNNIEDGIANQDTLIVNIVVDENPKRLDKTWQEIYDAIDSGRIVYVVKTDNYSGKKYYYIVYWVGSNIDEISENIYYYVYLNKPGREYYVFDTQSPSGYPVWF